jgi:hypothetical protein
MQPALEIQALGMQAQCLGLMRQAMIGHDRPAKADVSHLDDLYCMPEGLAVLAGSVRLAQAGHWQGWVAPDRQ